jgi:hypothetical protein
MSTGVRAPTEETCLCFQPVCPGDYCPQQQSSSVPHPKVEALQPKGQGPAADEKTGVGGVPSVRVAGMSDVHACSGGKPGRVV